MKSADSGRFKAPTIRRYPWSAVHTSEEYIRLLSTYSDHISLSGETRERLFASIRRLIDDHGGAIERPYLAVLFCANRIFAMALGAFLVAWISVGLGGSATHTGCMCSIFSLAFFPAPKPSSILETDHGELHEHLPRTSRELPARTFDVVVAGGGTGGVVAAIAAARQGANTVLIEAKGYLGGIVVEGGTALHSFYNLWKAFPGVEKRQVVKGIPQEIVDRLAEAGGTSGHAEMMEGYDYDSVCTAIDTEIYKLVTFEMLVEAGVTVCVNTLLTGAIMDGSRVDGVIAESRSGREAIFAHSFVDCTGYGDLCAHAGAEFTEPNDYPVANSIGVGGVNVEKYYEFLKANDALKEYAAGWRDGKEEQIVRLRASASNLPTEFMDERAADRHGHGDHDRPRRLLHVHQAQLQDAGQPHRPRRRGRGRTGTAPAPGQGHRALPQIRARLREGLHRPHQPVASTRGAAG